MRGRILETASVNKSTHHMVNRVPFTLTYVTYDENSHYIGLLMSLLTLTPIFIIVALTSIVFVTLLFESRERAATSTTISFLTGQLMNDALSRLLKESVAGSKIIGDILGDLIKRPAGSDRDECGVPSNHAQSVAFFATFGSYLLLSEVRVQKLWVRDVLIIALYVLMILVAISRVYLEYHTAEQVSIGLGLGFVFAFLWVRVHRCVLRPKLSRFLVRFHNSTTAFMEFMPLQSSSHHKEM